MGIFKNNGAAIGFGNKGIAKAGNINTDQFKLGAHIKTVK